MLLLAFAATPLASARSQSRAKPQTRSPQASSADRLGMTCVQILQMTSSDWIAKIAAMDASPQGGQLRGIRVYGRCYDERTDRLAASLARTGKGPLMGARANFRYFDAALKDFTAKALAAAQPPGDAVKTAYASLYEKQFRYDFYRSYQEKMEQSRSLQSPALAPATNAAVTAAAPAPNDVDPLTKAKNHFGELLDVLPEDKMHQLHAAFGNVVDTQLPSGETQFDIYRYAIFVLEPFAPPNSPGLKSQPKPFSPTPF